MPPSKRKTILSALVIITNPNESKKYGSVMMDDIKEYAQEIGKQEKTEAMKKTKLKTLPCIFLRKENSIIYRHRTQNTSKTYSIYMHK